LDAHRKVFAIDQTAVTVFLEIKEAGCSLNIGKSFRVLLLKQLKPFATCDAELQIPDKFLVVKLADTQEIENFFIKIIQHFNIGWFFMKKDLSAAAEWFDIAVVLGNKRDDLLRNTVLTTQIR